MIRVSQGVQGIRVSYLNSLCKRSSTTFQAFQNTAYVSNKANYSQLSGNSKHHANLMLTNFIDKNRSNSVNSNSISSLPSEKSWQEMFSGNQLDKIVNKLLLESDEEFTLFKRLIEMKILTFNEFSILLNKLIKANGSITNLDALADFSNKDYSTIFFGLFKVYINAIPNDSLTYLQLCDLNLFISFFIQEGELGRAQIVLKSILDRKGSILNIHDAETVIHYLQLRCGALPRNWMFPNNTSSSSFLNKNGKAGSKYNTRLGLNRHDIKLTNRYRLIEPKSVLKIANKIMNDEKWININNSKLDSAIIYSLSYSGQLSNVSNYISSKWGSDLDLSGDISSRTTSEIPRKPPTSEVMEALLTAFAYNDNSINRAMQVLDKISKKYPDMELNQTFWRRLIQWSMKCWDTKADKNGELIYNCLSILKRYYSTKGLQIPYDEGILNQLQSLIRITHNGKESINIIKDIMLPLFVKTPDSVTPGEKNLLLFFQKKSIQWLIKKNEYRSSKKFIEQWSIDHPNKKELLAYHEAFKQKHLAKMNKKLFKKKLEGKTIDDIEEDDMLLGKLW